MKKLIFILLFLVSCYGNNQTPKDRSNNYEEICIKGHVYYDGYNRLSIKLDDNGKPIKCNK